MTEQRQADRLDRPARLAYLTAGAGGMYCGSCMQDNALAAAMQQQGWDVDLIPIYTPIRTDEQTVAVDQIFFGGINIYLQQHLWLFRHLPGWLDRILDRPWLIRRATAKAVETDPKFLGELTVSMLRGEHGYQRKELLRLTRHLQQRVRPQLLLLTNILIGGGIPLWKQQLQIPIYVILQGDDVFLDYLPADAAAQAVKSIREIAGHVDGFLVHSEFYGQVIAERFQLDPNKLLVTPLGINKDHYRSLADKSPGSPRSIGYLARLAPQKGLHHLVDAFILLKQDPRMADVRLEIAGWLGEDHRAFAEQQLAKLTEAGLHDSFRYHGIVDRDQKIRLLHEIDLLCVPTDFVEPKGLYALEAMAAGTPVLAPSHGAFPELIAASGGGWLVEPRSPERLAEQLAEVLSEPESMKAAGQRGRQYVLEHRSIERTSQRVLTILRAAVQSP